jgi:hypothetical protein
MSIKWIDALFPVNPPDGKKSQKLETTYAGSQYRKEVIYLQ